MSGTELDGKWQEYKKLLEDGKLSITEMDSYTKPLAFPALIADELKVPCYNFAMSGGSNERSLRLLIKNIDRFTDPLILFGYTSHIRKEFFYPLKGNELIKDDTDFVQVGSIANAWHGCTSGKSVREKNFLSDLFLKHFAHEYDNTADIALAVECIVKHFSLNVIHIPLLKSKNIFELQKKMPAMKVYDFDGKRCFQLWYTAAKFDLHDYGHPVQEAHIELAKNLVKYINADKNLNSLE